MKVPSFQTEDKKGEPLETGKYSQDHKTEDFGGANPSELTLSCREVNGVLTSTQRTLRTEVNTCV
jgi:hypothetical protein